MFFFLIVEICYWSVAINLSLISFLTLFKCHFQTKDKLDPEFSNYLILKSPNTNPNQTTTKINLLKIDSLNLNE